MSRRHAGTTLAQIDWLGSIYAGASTPGFWPTSCCPSDPSPLLARPGVLSPSAEEVGNAFVQHYYQAFDSDANARRSLCEYERLAPRGARARERARAPAAATPTTLTFEARSIPARGDRREAGAPARPVAPSPSPRDETTRRARRSVRPSGYNVVKIDIQPGTSANALIIFVTGHISGGADASIHFASAFNWWRAPRVRTTCNDMADWMRRNRPQSRGGDSPGEGAEAVAFLGERARLPAVRPPRALLDMGRPGS